MKDYQTSSEEASATTHSFHYKYRRRKMMATQVTSLSLLSLLFITSHVRLTLGFAPHSLVSVSAPKKRHQFASQRSDDDRQSRAPFFMENVDEQQQQQQQQQQQESANTSWNTVQQSNGYTQQQTEEQYSETTAVNGQYQSQQDYYYQESSQPQAAPEQQQQPSSAGPYSSSQDDGGISNVDARVLESILADGKLDLNSEEEVKKLLEGPRRTEDFRVDFNNGEEDESKYSSKVISSVSDNKFWNSVRAKGFELIDTVGIIIANRIERDTKTLAAIGIFGLDRIRQDIGRALPAAGRQVKKLLLSSNSTYVEQLLDATENTPFALPSERSITKKR